jgi:tetratricopeptide (TPR) repeat protein
MSSAPEPASAARRRVGVRPRLRSALAWASSRRRLSAIALLAAVVAAASAWAAPQVRAWRHLRAARTELGHYHTSQAIRHLKVCRELWPHDPAVMLLAARAARRAGVYGDGARLLSLYEQERGRDDAVAFERLLLAAETDQDAVVERCWQLVEAGHPDSPLLMESLARGYMRRYPLGMARRCLDRWGQSQPDSPQVHYLDGLFHLDYAHAVSAAVASYARAVELDPEHEEARLGLAVALLTSKDFGKAAEHFELLRRVQPDNARVRVGLAECRDGLGDTAGAVRLADGVLAQRPDFPAALALRGHLAFRQGQFAEAATWLLRAVRRNPADHRARYGLALALEQAGRAEEAKEHLRHFQQTEKDLARFNEIVTTEIAKRPADPALHCELGQILLRSGQREEGTRWLQSALQIDPGYAPARRALIDYQRTGRVALPVGPP